MPAEASFHTTIGVRTTASFHKRPLIFRSDCQISVIPTSDFMRYRGGPWAKRSGDEISDQFFTILTDVMVGQKFISQEHVITDT